MLQIKPLEEAYKFGSFFSSLLSESDFEAKPSVLLLGQYSTGKTTFIKHLLGRDYPGIHIGPEPTTGEWFCSCVCVCACRTPVMTDLFNISAVVISTRCVNSMYGACVLNQQCCRTGSSSKHVPVLPQLSPIHSNSLMAPCEQPLASALQPNDALL